MPRLRPETNDARAALVPVSVTEQSGDGFALFKCCCRKKLSNVVSFILDAIQIFLEALLDGFEHRQELLGSYGAKAAVSLTLNKIALLKNMMPAFRNVSAGQFEALIPSGHN
jgi:hypothetical protein